MTDGDNVVAIDARQPHVVLIGDPLSGFRVVGPFPTLTALREWTEANCKDEWWRPAREAGGLAVAVVSLGGAAILLGGRNLPSRSVLLGQL